MRADNPAATDEVKMGLGAKVHKTSVFARGHMALNAVSNQIVVPLGPGLPVVNPDLDSHPENR